MSNFDDFVSDNLVDMIDEPNRCVELSAVQLDELAIAVVEDDGDFFDWLLTEMSVPEFNQMQADMVKAFAGRMSHDEFFLKYAGAYYDAKRNIVEHYEDKIWNAYCDQYNPAPFDHYAEYGLKRSDF